MSDAVRATLHARSGARLIVRRLGPADVPALQGFNAALSVATRNVFLPHGYGEATLQMYSRRNQTGADLAYLLHHGDEVVGYFFLWEFDQPVPLLGIGLADAWQGQGLGVPMIQLLIEDATASGREGIELTTVPENERAFHLYRRVGFQYLGDVENVAGDGRVVRERRMFLPLKPGVQPPPREFRPPV